MSSFDVRCCPCPAAEPVSGCGDLVCDCGPAAEEAGNCACGHHLDDHDDGGGECLAEIREEVQR